MSMGVRVNGKDAPSKAAIRRALAEDPASVYFYGTDFVPARNVRDGGPWDPRFDGMGMPANQNRDYIERNYPGFADGIARGVVTFVGPNPHTSRKFYGQIVWTRDGRIGVK